MFAPTYYHNSHRVPVGAMFYPPSPPPPPSSLIAAGAPKKRRKSAPKKKKAAPKTKKSSSSSTAFRANVVAIAKARVLINAGYPLGQVLGIMHRAGTPWNVLDTVAEHYGSKTSGKRSTSKKAVKKRK